MMMKILTMSTMMMIDGDGDNDNDDESDVGGNIMLLIMTFFYVFMGFFNDDGCHNI